MNLATYAALMAVGGVVGLRVSLAVLGSFAPQYQPLARGFDAVVVAIALNLLRVVLTIVLFVVTVALLCAMVVEAAARLVLRVGHRAARRLGNVPVLPAPEKLRLPSITFAERSEVTGDEVPSIRSAPM